LGLIVAGTSGKTLFQVENKVPGGSTIRFMQPYALNNVDPRRMIIGTNFLYESTDMGDTLISLGGLVNQGGGNYRPDNPVGPVSTFLLNGLQLANPIAYGGFSNIRPFFNPDALWAGAGGQLLLRV